MRRALVCAVLVLAGCQYEWVPEFEHPPTITCGASQTVQVSVGNAYEDWNEQDHDLRVLSVDRRQGSGGWVSVVSGPVTVAAPEDPAGDPEADGVNWVTFLDAHPLGSTATWEYRLVWDWVDAGTPGPPYEQNEASKNVTLPGC